MALLVLVLVLVLTSSIVLFLIYFLVFVLCLVFVCFFRAGGWAAGREAAVGELQCVHGLRQTGRG